MDNALSIGKKAFAIAVAAATIVWSVGLASFAVPSAQAAASEGDLIKGTSLSTVYFYGYDGQRYTFPNEKTFFSWFADFDSTETISDGDLADIDLAGNAVVRPGTYWVKITSDPKTYAVSTDGTIRWVEDEATAVDFAGSDWASGIIDVPDAFFVDYTTGSSLMTADAFDGMLYMDGGDYYLALDGEKRLISSAGMTANNYQSKFFLDGASIDDSALTAGDDITSEVSALTDPSQMGGDVVTGGDMTVSLASSSAAAASVPNTATGVEVATYKFTAASAATLSALTVELTGLIDVDAILANGVYLYEGGERLTDGRSVNSSTRTTTFSSLGLSFDANETRYITVVVDMDTTITSGSFAFAIDSADSVDTDGDVAGTFPVTGHTMSVEDLDVGSITIEDTGSLADPSLGQADATIAKFKLSAGSVEDIDVNGVTLNINNAADQSEFVLLQGTDEVATGTDIGSDLVLFEFTDAFFLEAGSNETFTVKAKIGGEVDDTIVTSLENNADLDAVGRDFGFGVTVTNNYDGGAGEFSTVTVQGGDVTVAFNGPSAADVKDGADDFSLFDFSITSERWVDITNLTFAVTATDMFVSPDAALTDYRIVNTETGALVLGPEEATIAGEVGTVVFTDDLIIEAGETLDLTLTADMDATVAEANHTFIAVMDLTGAMTVEDEAGDAVTDIVPGSDLSGYTMTVQSPALTVALASTPTGDTSYVKGTSDVTVVGYNFTASNGSDLTVTDLTVTIFTDEDSGSAFSSGDDDGADVDVLTTDPADRINSCSLYDSSSGDLIAGPESVTDTTGVIIFESFSYAIPAGEAETAVVKCNLANVAPGTDDQFAWEIVDPTTAVSAEDDEGDALAAASINGGVTTTINTTPSTYISVTESGTLAVTDASDAPDSDFIMTGSTLNTAGKFRFDSSNEAFVVNRLTVTEEQAEADNATVDSDAYANNVSSVTISYPMEDGTTGNASGSLTGNEVTFNSLLFYVPKDDDAAVTVKVNVATSDRHSGSATSNEKIRMGLSRETTNDDQVRAVGQSSGVTLDDDDLTTIADGNAAQGIFVVRETKPTVALHSSSPSGSSKTPGDQEVYRFTVAANAGEDVVLNELIFAISSTDNGASGYNVCDAGNDGDAGAVIGATINGLDDSDFDLYNLSTLGTGTAIDADADWSFLDSDGSVCTDDTDNIDFAHVTFDDENIVPAGTSNTYALYINLNYISSDPDDSIQVTLASDPIVSTFLGASDLNETDLTETDTTLTVTASAGYTVGDVLCMDTDDTGCGTGDERMLLVSVTDGTTIVVVRGYMNSDPDSSDGNDALDDIDRMPSAFLWEDDGSETDTSVTQEIFGAYLVDSLPVTGNALGF